MKKCDGQVEGRLKHFFSIMELAANGLATAPQPAEATRETEEKPKQEVVMRRKGPRRGKAGGCLRLQVRTGSGNNPYPYRKFSSGSVILARAGAEKEALPGLPGSFLTPEAR